MKTNSYRKMFLNFWSICEPRRTYSKFRIYTRSLNEKVTNLRKKNYLEKRLAAINHSLGTSFCLSVLEVGLNSTSMQQSHQMHASFLLVVCTILMATSFWSPLTIAKENFSSLAWAEAEAALLAVSITIKLHLKLVIIKGKRHLHRSFFIGKF